MEPEHILIIEDEADMAALLGIVLAYDFPETEGHVIKTLTGDFSLALRPEVYKGVTTAIVDLMLPLEHDPDDLTIPGVRILQYLRDYHPHVWRIAFTAVEWRIEDPALADQIVSKPALATVLTNAIKARRRAPS